MERESFVFYRSFYDAIRCMPPEVQAEIYPAVCEYALFGNLPENLSEVARGMFTLIKPNLDVSIVRYKSGRKGGRKARSKSATAKPPATPKSATAKKKYALSYDQEIERMRADQEWKDTVCADYGITADEYDSRLSRFLRHCLEEGKRKDRAGHGSFEDAQSHFRYWITKAYPAKSPKQKPSVPDESSVPFPEMGEDFGGMDYDEQ